jgi:hypothetical protein
MPSLHDTKRQFDAPTRQTDACSTSDQLWATKRPMTNLTVLIRQPHGGTTLTRHLENLSGQPEL